MSKSEINKRIKEINSSLANDNDSEAIELVISLFEDLQKEKLYSDIVKIYDEIKHKFQSIDDLYCFELAYALVELKKPDDAEEVYDYLNLTNPDNTAVLNNLSNLKKQKKKYKEAYELIKKAYQLDSSDAIISNNYESLKQIIEEIDTKEKKFKNAVTYLSKENQFVVTKLESFYSNVKKDKDFKNNLIAIPKWKFKVLMQTDDIKAESLKDQWLDKGYILNTGNRDEHYVYIYEVNPYIEKEIAEIKVISINPKWIKGIENIEITKLTSLGYFKRKKSLKKLKKKYKTIIERDFDELVLNYILGNDKSVIVLSGSIIETVLIFYLEKQKIQKVDYEINNKKVSKDLYDCNLNDLLMYADNEKFLAKQYVHLGNISRIYRNFIHPGKEVKEIEELDETKSHLCYISVMEIIDYIIK